MGLITPYVFTILVRREEGLSIFLCKILYEGVFFFPTAYLFSSFSPFLSLFWCS